MHEEVSTKSPISLSQRLATTFNVRIDSVHTGAANRLYGQTMMMQSGILINVSSTYINKQ